MKKFALRSQRRFFPSFQTRLTPKYAILFVAQSLLIFLFCSVDRLGFALALSLICAFCYARQNVFVLTPVFCVACVVFDLSWWSLVYSISPILLLAVLYAIFFKLRKNVPLFCVALCAVVGMGPYAAIKAVFERAYIQVGASIIVALVGIFCFGICAYAVLVRQTPGKTTLDEIVCGALFIAVLGYAMRGVGGSGFWLYSSALCFGVLLCSVCYSQKIPLLFAALFCMGGAIRAGSISLVGEGMAVALACLALSPFTKYCSALAMIGVEGIMWLFDAYLGAGWQSIVMCAVGVILFLCLPKSVLFRLQSTTQDSGRLYAGIVNRRGRELADRLVSVSDVFFDMSKRLKNDADSQGDFCAATLAKDVASSCCCRCADRDGCFCALGGDTSKVLEGVAECAINRGKVTILDMPPFVTSRCTRVHALINAVNSCAAAFEKRKEDNECAKTAKRLMSEQFAGVALLLDSLSQDCAKSVNFIGDLTQLVRAELLKHNIVASEIVICGREQDVSVALFVRSCDAQKSVLAKLVSRVLKTPLVVDKVTQRGDGSCVYLCPSPTFEIAYGIARRLRDGEVECGDTSCVLAPSRRQRLFVLCDGMGSGKEAFEASQNAVSMLEGFYKSGIENDILLGIVNKLLKLDGTDRFCTIDVAAVDTSNGWMDVIKCGACNSYIVRNQSIEVLSCTAPPLGILDDVSVRTSRYRLFEGDIVLMMSDGVFDALEDRGVAEVVDCQNTKNPQTLANALLQKAVQMGAKDDCTVVVLRLFCA